MRDARILDSTRWLVERAAAANVRVGFPLHAPVPSYAGNAVYASSEFREAWMATTSEPGGMRPPGPSAPVTAPAFRE